MTKVHRQAKIGIDSDKPLIIILDEFLFYHGKKYAKQLRDLQRLASKYPSPADAGNIAYLKHALGTIADLRHRNCPSVFQPLEQVNADRAKVR